MALRGDLVGEAFVRITADTTEMRRAIRRAGEEDGKAYGKKFSEEVTNASDNLYRRQRRNLAAAISDPKQFDQLAKNFSKVEEAAVHFRNDLETLYAQKQMTRKETDRYTAAVNKWEKSAIKARDAAYQMAEADKASARAKGVLAHHVADQERALERQNRALARAAERQSAAWSTYGKNLLAGSRTEETVIVRREGRFNRFVDRLVIGTDRADRTFSKLDRAVGRAFGKGSRNNFLNWIGSMVGGMVKLGTSVITFPAKAFAHVANSFSDAFSASRAANAGKLLSTGRGILAVFGGKGGLAGLAVGVVAGAFALGKILPGTISLLTQLGGVITSLVGSIGIGLVGALLAMAPAAVGAAAALGGVFGAINAFAQDKENAKFWESVFQKPFEKFNKQFAPKVKTFLTGIRSGFAVLLEDAKPGVDQFFDSFKSRFNDPTTVHSLNLWSDTIGYISTKINDAVTALGSGLVAFFVPVLPYAEKLSDYIDRIAIRFDKWANSPEGQNAIAEFMKGAWENARLVKDILVEIGSILGTVFSSGDKTGVSFLEGIRGKLQEIDAFLKTPEGRSKLDAFFGDVKSIGEGFGQLVLDVGRMIKNFNDPNARASAKDLMDSLVKIGDAAVKVTEMADAIGRIIDYLSNPALSLFTDIVGKITGVDVKNPKAGAGAGATPAVPTAPLTTGNGPVLPSATLDIKTTLNGQGFTKGGNDEIFYRLGMTPKQVVELAGYVVPVDMDATTYEATKNIIQQFKFSGKTVLVKGNEAAWNETKGTVAGYAFDAKTVQIKANAEPLYATIAEARRRLRNLGITVPIAGAGRQGGLTVGNSAAGRIVYGPHMGLTGEAGPEAIVPLDRDLSRVDPAVRALSAIAQGKAMAGGGVVGVRGRTLNVHPGAITVVSPHSDPALVAEAVLDRLVAFG